MKTYSLLFAAILTLFVSGHAAAQYTVVDAPEAITTYNTPDFFQAANTAGVASCRATPGGIYEGSSRDYVFSSQTGQDVPFWYSYCRVNASSTEYSVEEKVYYLVIASPVVLNAPCPPFPAFCYGKEPPPAPVAPYDPPYYPTNGCPPGPFTCFFTQRVPID